MKAADPKPMPKRKWQRSSTRRGASKEPESSPNDLKASRDFKPLRRIVPYLLPYKKAVLGALLALVAASATVLAIGGGLRGVIDRGFEAHDPAMLVAGNQPQTLVSDAAELLELALQVGWIGREDIGPTRMLREPVEYDGLVVQL